MGRRVYGLVEAREDEVTPEEKRARNLESVKRYRAKNPEKVKASFKAWQEKNREHRNAYANARYHANPDPVKEASRIYRLQHPEFREVIKAWRKRNHAYVIENNRKRRALQKSASVEAFTQSQLEDHMQSLGYRCVYCGGPFESIDHDIPLCRGGPHALSNLVPSCTSCNSRKRTKTGDEFRALR
jgi:5-methylcytosine-specific restriction endonuclease McrA